MDPLGTVEMDGGSLRGTPGFYRVGKSTAGRWWLVMPNGKPMLYKGCNAALRQEVGAAGDNMYFQWVEKEYGPDHRRFIDDTARTLCDAGFNGFGGWSMLFTPREGHREIGMPFVEIVAAREIVGPDCMVVQPDRDEQTGKLIGWKGCFNLDAFDPLCWQRIDRYASQNYAELRDNPNLLGYYSDNECMYGQPHTDAAWTGKLEDLEEPPRCATLLQRYLAQPEGKPGGEFAWKWALERHGGSVEQLARDWGADFSTVADFRAMTNERDVILTSDRYSEDHAEFTRLYVREYYTRMNEIIRRYDPNHMIMTTRCPAPPGVLVLRAMRECWDDGLIDVLAMNSYRDDFYGRLEEFHGPTQMPIMNGEFNWCSGHFLDWGKYLREELFTEDEKAEIRVRGRMALETGFSHPALVGYTWFKWYSGKEFTRDEYGLATDQPFGAVVNNRGEINTFNAPLFREIHPRLERIATGEIEPTVVEGLEPVPQTC